MNHETRQHDDAQGERDNRRELTARRNFLLLLVSAPYPAMRGCRRTTLPSATARGSASSRVHSALSAVSPLPLVQPTPSSR